MTPHTWLDLVVLQSLLALNRNAAAASEVALHNSSGPEAAFHSVITAAAAGDRERGDRALARLRQEADGSDFFVLNGLAVLGYRAEANQVAAHADQRALGPLPLVLVTLFCGCGAPFDLAATPNFAAMLAEGDLPWPPQSPINFPLKDW